MTLQRLAAFSDGDRGGNPAGVLITETLPADTAMQRMAAEVGYSETVFAAPQGDGWRVRYFSPTVEVPFCGHATLEALSGSRITAADPMAEALRVRQPGPRFDAFLKAEIDHLASLL